MTSANDTENQILLFNAILRLDEKLDRVEARLDRRFDQLDRRMDRMEINITEILDYLQQLTPRGLGFGASTQSPASQQE